MSAVMTRRRNRRARTRDREASRQVSLFSQPVRPLPRERDDQPEAAVAAPVTEAPDAAALAPATLDEAVATLWATLLDGEAAACPVCGDSMRPLQATAGVTGARCESCGSTVG